MVSPTLIELIICWYCAFLTVKVRISPPADLGGLVYDRGLS
jgi:hypothetical protein